VSLACRAFWKLWNA